MKMMKRRYAAIPTPAMLRITGSLATMGLLLWAISCGIHLAMEPWRYKAVASQAFHVGVSTMVFGFLFVLVGLSILADLFLNISQKVPDGQHQGQEGRTISKAMAKAFVTVITALMISWVMYTAFRLATESGDTKHHLLTFSIGVTTILFGLIYFIIGVAIVAELAIDM